MRLDVSSQSSARQRIILKHQALVSSKDKSKNLNCHLLQCSVNETGKNTNAYDWLLCVLFYGH